MIMNGKWVGNIYMEDFILKGPLILIIMRIAGKRKHTHAFILQKCFVLNIFFILSGTFLFVR